MLNQESYNDILTPREVALLMPSSVPISWIYAHWEDLGGIRIGRRKLILRSVLYANLQGEGLLVRENREGRKEMDTPKNRNEANEVEEEKRGQTGGGRVEAKGGTIKNHSNEFGLVDALQ
jgi:hypothetical protein